MKWWRWLTAFGMIGVFFFLLLTILGRMLWPGYNPITMYVSDLVASEAPNAALMRFFMNAYTLCFFVFSFIMSYIAFHKHHGLVKTGYLIQFISSLVAVIGFGGYPFSMVMIFSKNDIIHVLTTVLILSANAISLLLIAIGYLKQEKLNMMGQICLTACILFVAFNLFHLYAILTAKNILGLVERMIFYSFHALTIILSFLYTFRMKGSYGISHKAFN